MTRAHLETLEEQVNADLNRMAAEEKSIHGPITDGVVDIDRYLASSPKMLWILKEPWEKLGAGEGGGGWSLTKNLIPALVHRNQIGGSPTYRKMAYVTNSILNNFLPYSDIPATTDDPRVRESLQSIAYINVSKCPGATASVSEQIGSYYRRNRDILRKQVEGIDPDVVITGNIMHLFYEDFGLTFPDLKSEGSVEFCRLGSRLYINAYHPAYWRCKQETYVNDLVAVIKNHGRVLPST